MERTNKRYIIWDLDGTLWDFKKNEVELMAETLEIPYSKDLEDQFFYMIKEFEKRFFCRKIRQNEICKLIEETMPALTFYGFSGRQFLEAWNSTDTTILNKHAKDVLEKASLEGAKNIVATDWLLEKQLSQLKQFDLLKYIEWIYSCENNYMKANPKSISYIIKPGREEDYIIIGNSIKNDIAFANNAGIDSIWYNANKKENDTTYKPTYEVENLIDVLEYI